jgi:hypothetical protein
MDFTGTRLFTSLRDSIPRVNGTMQYVSNRLNSSLPFSNDGERGSCFAAL